MNNIAIFASGNGSNAQRIAAYFSDKSIATVALIISNRKEAYVLERAKSLQIPAYHLSKEQFATGDDVLALLQEYRIDFIVLAGFLLLIPQKLIQAFPNAIVNVHPALLPKFGGKGMYGSRVHEAVIAAGERESGITVHFVNEKFDDGAHILQATCPVAADDTPDTLAKKIHQLEYEYFPKAIERVLAGG
ncbi:MAG: phosphoribosylglycinamide formyltransferase [Bacteroidales bacterium]|nr:phosphoribosylglycinamide formyltransferase [Bacteroidales bacterium]